MAFNRTASQLAPLLLRNGTRTEFRRSPQFQRHLPAIAILVPHRAVSTETSTSGSSGNYPPPGFNAEQAKKPLSKEQTQKKAQDQSATKKAANDRPDVSIPANAPSEHAPTTSAEAMSVNEMAVEKDAVADAKHDKKKEVEKKLTIRQKIMKEVHHYWDGTKLLATEVKISSKLALKMAAGYELTRREHRQVRWYAPNMVFAC